MLWYALPSLHCSVLPCFSLLCSVPFCLAWPGFALPCFFFALALAFAFALALALALAFPFPYLGMLCLGLACFALCVMILPFLAFPFLALPCLFSLLLIARTWGRSWRGLFRRSSLLGQSAFGRQPLRAWTSLGAILVLAWPIFERSLILAQTVFVHMPYSMPEWGSAETKGPAAMLRFRRPRPQIPVMGVSKNNFCQNPPTDRPLTDPYNPPPCRISQQIPVDNYALNSLARRQIMLNLQDFPTL
ncbi:MAG: hypothetical protein KBT08_03790 [Bacteroidales bacterium]|nr:hypothetical protein [Candidatus Cryptobacteroides onthequi]